MWTVIIIVIALLVFGFIRGSIRASGIYRVFNKNGVVMHTGTYLECVNYAKAQNNYCKTFGIDDSFVVKRWKL